VFVKFHWTPKAGTTRCVGRGGEDLRRRPGLPPPRPVGTRSRPATSRIRAGAADLHRRTGRAVQLRHPGRDQAHPRGAGAGAPVGRMVLNRNPDNFFAETEQVAFCTSACGAGHRLQQRPAAGRAHPLVRGHPDLAAGRPELPRDPDQRADRAGAQQPARRHAPPGHPARAVSYEPNSLAGGCPFQAGAEQGFVSVAARAHGARRAGQGTRQAGEVCRPLHPGDAVLRKPDTGRAITHRRSVPV
jgi:catalase